MGVLEDPVFNTKAGKKLTEELGDEIQIWGTRYAIGDYYDFLLQNLENHGYNLFFRTIYKNNKNSDGGYIWPEKFSDDYVQTLRRRAGNIRFSSQYLNKVVASEDIVFHSDRLQVVSPNAIIYDETPKIKLKVGESMKEIQVWCVVDPAISLKKKADFSVIMVGGQDADQNLYVLDFTCERMEPNKLVEETYRLLDKYKLGVLGLEVVSMQKAIVYTFKDKFREYRPIAIKEIIPEGEKKGRIRGRLEPLIYNSMLYVMPWMKSHKELQDELLYFPSDTVHDDILDAMAMLVHMSKPTNDRSRNRNRNAISHFNYNTKYGGRVR